MPNKVVAFDLDGTLIDSLDSSALCIQAALKKQLEKHFTTHEIQRHFGQPEERVFQALAGNEALQELMALYLNEINTDISRFPLYPGIAPLIDELKNHGYRLALYTARGDRATDLILKTHGIKGEFSLIVSGNDVERLKPDPEGLVKISKTLHVPPQNIIYTGDSHSDWIMAESAGVTGTRALWGNTSDAALPSTLPAFTRTRDFLAFVLDNE